MRNLKESEMTIANTNKPEVSAGAINVIKLARECGFDLDSRTEYGQSIIKSFANSMLDAAAQRCIEVMETGDFPKPYETYHDGHLDGCNNCAAAIREMKS